MARNHAHSTPPADQPKGQNPSQLTQRSQLNLSGFQLDYYHNQNADKVFYGSNNSNFEIQKYQEDLDSSRCQQDISLSNRIVKTSSESDPGYKSKIKKICIYGIIVAILTLLYMLLQIVLGNSYKKKTYFIVMMLSVAQIFAYSILLYKKTKRPTLRALKMVYRMCFDFILVFLLISLLFTFANLLLSRLWYLVVSQIFNTIPIFFVRILVHVCLRPKESHR